MSAIVAVTGYMMISGSKPRLKEKTETAIVIGDTKTRDKPMVPIITAKMLPKSIMVAHQRNRPNIHVVNPMAVPLTNVSVTTAC